MMDVEIKIALLENGKIHVEMDDKRPSFYEDWNRELTIEEFLNDIGSYLVNYR